MNTLLNYLIEANLALVFFYLVYWLLLRKEHQFAFRRTYLLVSLMASLLFPLISIPINSEQLIPSLSNSMAANWLPEITIYGNTPNAANGSQISIWKWMVYIYCAGLLMFSILFMVRIASLTRIYRKSKKYYWKNYRVAESAKKYGTFSFFHYIFLDKANALSEEETQDVLIHEEMHIQKMHSLDIVLIHLLGIAFWFNPIIRFYRNSFVQVHEFEADARSVEGRDANAYCNLLARVALQSNGYAIANHFTNSLTLKRIMMMKTVRKKMKHWKVASVSVAIILIFFIVACQDQVMRDIQTITDNSSAATLLPPEVEAELIKLKELNPHAEYIVLEMNEEGKQKLEELDKNEEFTKSLISMNVIKTADQSFVILQKGDKTNLLSEMTASEGEIFTIVEESATPVDGFPSLYKYIVTNLKYPAEARAKGVEGKVFVEFTVNTDGTLSDVHALKGIGSGCDEEAVSVIKTSPLWSPGQQRGKKVRQRMVLPINFILESGRPAAIAVEEVSQDDYEFNPTVTRKVIDGKTYLTGTVTNQDGNPLTGTNIVIAGTTTGTVAAQDGTFKLESNQSSGTLVFSFIGFKTKMVSF